MRKFLRTRSFELPMAVIALTTLVTAPAWAGNSQVLPGPAIALLAGAAVVGAIVIAKLWRRK